MSAKVPKGRRQLRLRCWLPTPRWGFLGTGGAAYLALKRQALSLQPFGPGRNRIPCEMCVMVRH